MGTPIRAKLLGGIKSVFRSTGLRDLEEAINSFVWDNRGGVLPHAFSPLVDWHDSWTRRLFFRELREFVQGDAFGWGRLASQLSNIGRRYGLFTGDDETDLCGHREDWGQEGNYRVDTFRKECSLQAYSNSSITLEIMSLVGRDTELGADPLSPHRVTP